MSTTDNQDTGIMGTLVTPSFTDVQDRVQPGIYNVRIVSATSGKWPGKEGKKATRYLNWRMETFGEKDEKNNGRSIFTKTAIEGGGVFRLQDLYRAATGMDLTGGFDYSELYGSELEVTMGEQKDKPEYVEVKAFKAIKNHSSLVLPLLPSAP